jgi:hypothetical protein
MASIDALVTDLRTILDARLRSLVVYEAHGLMGEAAAADSAPDGHVHSLAVVERLGYEDLVRLAPLAAGWRQRGLAVPLFLGPAELPRSLDAFPLEFAQIVARHTVVVGEDPFAGLAVAERDLRRACETQARSHLLHLREGFLEAAGHPGRVAELVNASAAPLRALIANIARLYGVEAQGPAGLERFVAEQLQLDVTGLRPLLSPKSSRHLRDADAGAFFENYLRAVEQLAALVDEWTR